MSGRRRRALFCLALILAWSGAVTMALTIMRMSMVGILGAIVVGVGVVILGVVLHDETRSNDEQVEQQRRQREAEGGHDD